MPLATTVIVITYGEIALKGRNRPRFQRRLINNIRIALKNEPVADVDHVESRFLVPSQHELGLTLDLHCPATNFLVFLLREQSVEFGLVQQFVPRFVCGPFVVTFVAKVFGIAEPPWAKPEKLAFWGFD